MRTKTQAQSLWLWVLALLFAGTSAYLTMRSNTLYGAGLSPDSTGYIRLARDIVENGFAFLSENKAVLQPPFYPAVLAAFSKISGGDPLQVASWINVITSAILLIVIIFSVRLVTASFSVITVVGILACFSIPLRYVHSMAWTETLFILFISLIFLIICRPKITAVAIFMAGTLTAAACLMRYAGIVLIPFVSTFLFFVKPGMLSVRLKHAVSYALLPVTIFTLYVVRNYTISGTLLGKRAPSNMGFGANIELTIKKVLVWFYPSGIHSFGILLIGLFVLLGILAWLHREHLAQVIRGSHYIAFLCAAFVAVYPAFIVCTSTTIFYDRIDNRLLSPLYPSLLVLFALFLDRKIWGNHLTSLFALCGFCVLFVVAPFRATYSYVNIMARQGAGGYNSRVWQESDLINHFRKNEKTEGKIIFSNAPDALYILADVAASISPGLPRYKMKQKTNVTDNNLLVRNPMPDGAMLVWFNRNRRNYLYTPEDLEVIYTLNPINTFSDGTIYRIKSYNNRIEGYK